MKKKGNTVDAHDNHGTAIRIEQVIATGLVGNKSWMQERVIKEGDTDILRITGYANSHNDVARKAIGDNTNQRPTTYIKGAFEAVNLITAEKYMSGQLILPDSISGYVCAQLDMVGPLKLDVVIRVERAEKSVVGYKFAAFLHKMEAKTPPKEETPIEE